MYRLVYYTRITNVELGEQEPKVYNKKENGAEFRLRKNALHYVREIAQNMYREWGYATELITGGLCCYKSIKESRNKRIIDITVKVEKA